MEGDPLKPDDLNFNLIKKNTSTEKFIIVFDRIYGHCDPAKLA